MIRVMEIKDGKKLKVEREVSFDKELYEIIGYWKGSEVFLCGRN